MKENEITVLMVEPGDYNAQERLGYLGKRQASELATKVLLKSSALGDEVCIFCNGEDKIIGLESNR